MTREQTQKEVLALSEKSDILILELPTGYGKSKLAIDIQSSLTEVDSRYNFLYPKTLLIIAEIAHKINWEAEYKKHKMEHLLPNTTIIFYASLKNYTDTEWDLVVMDECHHLSDLRQEFLETLKFNKLIGLSATLNYGIKNAIRGIFSDMVVSEYKITSKEAINAEVLPQPAIILHELELDNKEPSQTVIFKRGNPKTQLAPCAWKDRFKYIGKSAHYELPVKCTEQEKYDHLTNEIEYRKSQYYADRVEWKRNIWMRRALDRKIYLGELKTRYVQKLLTEIPSSERLICFCTNIEQANQLGCEDTVVHSKVNGVSNVIASFQDGQTNALFAVGMLTEGMNLSNIDRGIIAQLDGSELKGVQKMGRAMRAKNPKIHILFFKNTRDQEYLEKFLEGVDLKFIEMAAKQ